MRSGQLYLLSPDTSVSEALKSRGSTVSILPRQWPSLPGCAHPPPSGIWSAGHRRRHRRLNLNSTPHWPSPPAVADDRERLCEVGALSALANPDQPIADHTFLAKVDGFTLEKYLDTAETDLPAGRWPSFLCWQNFFYQILRNVAIHLYWLHLRACQTKNRGERELVVGGVTTGPIVVNSCYRGIELR